VHKDTGGELGFAMGEAAGQNWTKVAETTHSVMYCLNLTCPPYLYQVLS
jgi:hypothetical protein